MRPEQNCPKEDIATNHNGAEMELRGRKGSLRFESFGLTQVLRYNTPDLRT
jgi:hypothetical protein